MSLAPGTRLGAYEITGPIGAGGMGEVYRARDTRLNRDVAIKVLPDAFASDAERLARFQREAHVLASLNHPHIAAIYGLEETANASALVLELVEGPTLADQIAQGALTLDEALPIATQIADALEAAHEQGIIHRDLKPSNIKLRPDGTVKVLDFGLAKLTEPTTGPSGAQVTQSPTITSPALMTGAGIILGTAAYMSPEQAKGRAADKRSDIWAFGCVLYEMLTGTRAFDGEDMADVLGAVVRLEPKWEAIPADVPPAVRALIQRCLVKDRRTRVSDIAAAKFVLMDPRGLLGAPLQPGSIAESSRMRPSWRVGLAIAATALAAGVLGSVLTRNLIPPAPTATLTRFSFPVPPAHQLLTTRRAVAISPDGKQFVYAGFRQLYLKSADEWEPRSIAGASVGDSTQNPVFSPDGTSLAFHAGAKGVIYRIPVGGGIAVPICEVGNVFGMTWHASGIVFASQFPRPGIFKCSPDGGPLEQLAKVGDDEVAFGPQILPGGRAMIFTVAKATAAADRWDTAQIVLQNLTSDERRTLVNGGSDGRFLPSGHLVYSVRGIVFAVPFDPEQQRSLGNAVAVIDGVRRPALSYEGTSSVSALVQSGAAHFDVSATGSLVYVPGPAGGAGTDRSIVFADRDGRFTLLPAPAAPYLHARASRDGARLVLDSDDGKEAIVWIYELAGTSTPRRLTFGGRNRFPIWSPDGQRVAFQSNRDGDVAIFEQRIDGTALRRLTRAEKGVEHIPESWTLDGKHLSYAVAKDATYSLSVLSVETNTVVSFDGVRSREPLGSTFSQNGRWIAYHSLPLDTNPLSPSAGVFVQPFPSGAIRQAPRVGRDFQPVWSPKGDELLYVALAGAGGQLAAVKVDWQSGLEFRTPQLLPGAVVGGRTSGLTRAFDVMPDGRFVGLVSGDVGDLATGGASASEIRVVLNWFEELKRLVPPK